MHHETRGLNKTTQKGSDINKQKNSSSYLMANNVRTITRFFINSSFCGTKMIASSYQYYNGRIDLS